MITIKTATQLYNTITAFNYDKTDEVSEWYVQGCKFSLSDGQLGHNHPTIGWYLAVDFERDAKRDAISSIQWVLDEYGQIFTFEILTWRHVEEQQCLILHLVKRAFSLESALIGNSYELEHDRAVRILSEVPMK